MVFQPGQECCRRGLRSDSSGFPGLGRIHRTPSLYRWRTYRSPAGKPPPKRQTGCRNSGLISSYEWILKGSGKANDKAATAVFSASNFTTFFIRIKRAFVKFRPFFRDYGQLSVSFVRARTGVTKRIIMVSKAVLIDDSDIDLFIQRRFLEVYKFSEELVLYRSAEEALNWLRMLNGEAPPDIIFLDLNMPDIDGFSFLENFDELPENIRSRSKIVVLTSSNIKIDKELALLNQNVIQFNTKPLKQADIEDLKKKISAS